MLMSKSGFAQIVGITSETKIRRHSRRRPPRVPPFAVRSLHCIVIDVSGAVSMLGILSSIVIHGHRAGILLSSVASEALPVVSDIQYDLLCYQPLPDQIQHQQFGHLADDQAALIEIIRAVQNLSGRNTVRGRSVLLDDVYRYGLPAPGMVDNQLCVDAENLVSDSANRVYFYPFSNLRNLFYLIEMDNADP